MEGGAGFAGTARSGGGTVLIQRKCGGAFHGYFGGHRRGKSRRDFRGDEGRDIFKTRKRAATFQETGNSRRVRTSFPTGFPDSAGSGDLQFQARIAGQRKKGNNQGNYADHHVQGRESKPQEKEGDHQTGGQKQKPKPVATGSHKNMLQKRGGDPPGRKTPP